MADTIKSANELKLTYSFYDGDTRLVSLSDPRSDITATDIKAVGTLAATTNPIIGDKGGARCVGIAKAVHVQSEKRQLDPAGFY